MCILMESWGLSHCSVCRLVFSLSEVNHLMAGKGVHCWIVTIFDTEFLLIKPNLHLIL